MKRTIAWLAVVGAVHGQASAQASVTLYGTVDVATRYAKADGQRRRLSEAEGGLNSSQLGFRGVEDLGGELKAGFTLLSGIGVDAGTTNGKFFNRQSTVSLFGPFGEIRLGRDYTPNFWNLTYSLSVVGIGASVNVIQLYPGTRMDNSIGYFLPAGLGGVFGQVMVAAPEGSSSGDKPARYIGGRFGYARGPWEIAIAAAQLRFTAPTSTGSIGLTGLNVATVAAAGDKHETWSVGGTYQINSFLQLVAHYDHERLKDLREQSGSLNARIFFGVSRLSLGYDRSRLRNSTGSSSTVDQIAANYTYSLSKRTAVYTTLTRMDNKDATALTVPGAADQTSRGGKSIGADFGVRHFF